MKYSTYDCKSYKTWTAGNYRIIKNKIDPHVWAYRYEVQKFDGKCWIEWAVRRYHTLAEAKKALEWIAEDDRMECEIQNAVTV